MAGYAGRTDQGPQTHLFGGINRQATIVNLKDNEAIDITNWDVNRGDLKMRPGWSQQSTVTGTTPTYFDIYTRQDGTTVYIAVVDGKFYEATSPAGPWTDRSSYNSVFLSEKTGADGIPIIGVAFGNAYILSGAGQAQPAYSRLNNALVTLENAARLDPPTNTAIVNVGTAGATTYNYVVTALTGRGETISSTVITTTTGNATLNSTNFNRITWDPVLGANGGYRVYKYDTVSSTYKALTVGVVSFTTATTFDDTGIAFYSPTINPPTTNGAYNTPNDWNANGYPEGFAPIAVGKDQRLLAWRKDTVWVSAANNCLDWLTTGADGAFVFTVYGAVDNRVTAVGSLYDLVGIFTRTNSLFYTGSSATDFTLNRIQGTGCFSPRSLVFIQNDLHLWSQYGPTSLQRIMQGANVSSTDTAEKIRPLVNDDTNKDYWWKIVCYNDVKARKAVWCYPATGAALNSNALVYNYQTGAWTKYSNFAFCGTAANPIGDIFYFSNASPVLFKQGGTTDNGTAITGTYQTGWYDLSTWMRKRMVWSDFVVDKRPGPYTINLSVVSNWGQNNTTQAHTMTESTTDGCTLLDTATTANYHRIYTTGDDRSFQYTITCTASANSPSILGWRPDARTKGVR